MIRNNDLYIKKSLTPGLGRGVFANRNFARGEIIESCPFIEVSDDKIDNILVTYLFFFGKNKQRSAIALGFGSIYNHSYTPNATFKLKINQQLIVFVALKNIKKDSEITFNYHHTDNLNTYKIPLWFEV